jgi:hypothetical protein
MLFEKLMIAQIFKKMPAFYGIRKFIIVLITAHHWSISYSTYIVHTPTPISLKPILVFSSIDDCFFQMIHICVVCGQKFYVTVENNVLYVREHNVCNMMAWIHRILN